ncbi:major facilitator superfamily domain-containing protein [Mycena metata]|uniref:Major facilitator superfamily domain-containing protein n=1 Tax=Mycena metata TaxID=1033252 RepID=A0AAD7JAL4_9AGAR|nr:major facilitator superfamily domain-containing protein [Mycena metata]
MAVTEVVRTVADYIGNSKLRPWLRNSARRNASTEASAATAQSIQDTTTDPELLLANYTSLFIVLLANALLQFSAYVTVSSASAYAAHLGGSTVFAGLTIGIPNVLSGLLLVPVMKIDQGRYTRPLWIACAALIVGNLLHAVAYRANFLYLILIGRLVSGIGYVGFMYVRRYCTDPRIVGVRRRTTLASWLVIGQIFGMSAGPFICGVLYKVGFSNAVFNGFTSPGWITSSIWLLFTVAIALLFRDLPAPLNPNTSEAIELGPMPLPTQPPPAPQDSPLTRRQYATIFTMCYASAACFFILGSFQFAIPIYTAVEFGYSPYAAGNFIALGGIATLPFLLASVRYAPRFQDRVIHALGALLGLTGLLILLVVLAAGRNVFGSLFVCWVLVALGFNLASTCTLSLLSKQLPDVKWNRRSSMAIQYSNYLGDVTGAVFGGAAVQIGMKNYVGVLIAIVGLMGAMQIVLWRDLKAKKG